MADAADHAAWNNLPVVAGGEALGLTDDEVAFYDALETNDSAVKVLDDDA